MDGRKILVVEDDRLVRNFILEGLQDQPYELLFATNGIEGLQVFQNERPELVLIDVLLPKMSGFELCQHIRKQLTGLKIPILFMSAVYKSLAVQNEAKQKYGANDFLTKPLNLNLLRERIGAYVHTNGDAPVAEQADDETEVAEVASDTAQDQAVSGDLSRESHAAVFFKIFSHKETGALHLTKGKVKKTVYFQEGQPVFVQSNLLNETLARVLIARGTLTQQQVEDTRLIAKQRGRLHGKVLMDLNLLTSEELEAVLAFQFAEKLLNPFTWTAGNFIFARGIAPPAKTDETLEVPPLFMQGVAERMPFDAIRDRMSPLAEHYVAWQEGALLPLAAFSLDPVERALLAEIAPEKTLKQILRASNQPDHLLRLVFALAVSGNLSLAPMLSKKEIAHTKELQAEIASASDVETPEEIAEEFSLVEQIAKKYTTLDTDDHFELLEVGRGAGDEEIRRAYLRLSKLFHPEKVGATVDASSQDKVEEIYVRITNAYDVLSDEDEREEYLAELGKTGA